MIIKVFSVEVSYCFSQLFHYFKRRGQVEDEVGKPLAVSDRCLCCNTVLTLCVRRSKQGHHAARNDWPNTTSFCVSRRSLDPRPPTLERTSGNRRRPRPYPALTLWTVCPSHSLALHFPLTPLRAWRHSVLPHPWKLFFFPGSLFLAALNTDRNKVFPLIRVLAGGGKGECRQYTPAAQNKNTVLCVHCFISTE